MFRTPVVLLVLVLVASGCTTLPRYKEAEAAYSSPVERKSGPRIVVWLESLFPGRPFDEVVCDNVVGATWNPEESKKIGFTQDYSSFLVKHLPALMLEASLPYNIGVGRVASGQSSLNAAEMNIDSRIMVPFGAFISRNLEQLLSSTNPQSALCFEKDCVEKHRRSESADRVVRVRFTKFRVAEDKRNTLTLLVEGVATTEDSTGLSTSSHIKQQIIERSITSEGHFHSDFLRVMNKTANEIASSVADDVVASASFSLMSNPSIDTGARR